MGKYFGTDGIRGKNEIFNQSLISNIVSSLIKTFDKDNIRVLVGGDTRESSETIIDCICKELQIRGAIVLNGGILPTPALSYLTSKFECDCGIIITASHNPYTDNGIKIINQDGEKLTDIMIESIEKYMDEENYNFENNSANLHEIESVHDVCVNLYLEKLSDCMGEISNNLKIGIDCSNGATSKVAKLIFKKLNANTKFINSDENHNNKINFECGSTHLDAISKHVVENKLDLGIAYDGDGDRTLLVTKDGKQVDGDHILAILAEYCELPKEMVITVMANQGLINWAKANDIKYTITDVGDTNVYEAMKEKDIVIGGEQSGHIILRNHQMHTGDGLLTSLVIVELLSKTGKSLDELSEVITKTPQIIKNVIVSDEEKKVFKTTTKANDLIKEYENLLENVSGRLNIRASGTESLIRITMWGSNLDTITEYSESMALKLKQLLEEK